MKNLLKKIGAMALLSLGLITESSYGQSIEVNITHIRSNKGYIRLALYNDANHFLDEGTKPFREYAYPIQGSICLVTLNDLPAGTYAIAILHDENKDKKMEKTWLGIPKEGWGFSNNVRPLLTKPSFQDCSIRTATKVEIKINYM